MVFKYTLKVNNHSSHSNHFMVYQKDPTSWSPNAMSLAWFSKFSNPSPTAKVQFSWTIDWGLAWAETGELQPGISFVATETYDLSEGNKATLDYNGAYQFVNFTKGPDPNR